ncbi:hypothetical protein AC578_626 [Pseudocercospora eumusae]|uniref:Uncharacterized protein n=1 Tax=Pseudocercospora eumusae TaxID=321146 RepID=A0A139HFE4_9PEZI|nr:hypothetical protein AC578_626 [Pseudocercospora eumusae]
MKLCAAKRIQNKPTPRAGGKQRPLPHADSAQVRDSQLLDDHLDNHLLRSSVIEITRLKMDYDMAGSTPPSPYRDQFPRPPPGPPSGPPPGPSPPPRPQDTSRPGPQPQVPQLHFSVDNQPDATGVMRTHPFDTLPLNSIPAMDRGRRRQAITEFPREWTAICHICAEKGEHRYCNSLELLSNAVRHGMPEGGILCNNVAGKIAKSGKSYLPYVPKASSSHGLPLLDVDHTWIETAAWNQLLDEIDQDLATLHAQARARAPPRPEQGYRDQGQQARGHQRNERRRSRSTARDQDQQDQQRAIEHLLIEIAGYKKAIEELVRQNACEQADSIKAIQELLRRVHNANEDARRAEENARRAEEEKQRLIAHHNRALMEVMRDQRASGSSSHSGGSESRRGGIPPGYNHFFPDPNNRGARGGGGGGSQNRRGGYDY